MLSCATDHQHLYHVGKRCVITILSVVLRLPRSTQITVSPGAAVHHMNWRHSMSAKQDCLLYEIISGKIEDHTAALSIESFGWKLLGPSSHRYPSRCIDVILPPTRSLPSVTRKLPPCREG